MLNLDNILSGGGYRCIIRCNFKNFSLISVFECPFTWLCSPSSCIKESIPIKIGVVYMEKEGKL